MTDPVITAIWYRVVQKGEFYNIERHPRVVQGGNGSLYIEIPKGLTPKTLQFFGEAMPKVGGSGFTIPAIPIGATDGVSFPITIMPKSNDRLRIANQNRQTAGKQRHPAWSGASGFPEAPDGVTSKDDATPHFPKGGLRVFIAKVSDGSYLAGFTMGTAPDDIARDDVLQRLWSNQGVGDVLVDLAIPIARGGLR